MTTSPKNRIAIYIRVSTDDQNTSLGSQEHRCRQYLASQNYSGQSIAQARVYRDEGYSGSNTDRPEFQRMMRDIRKGLVTLVIFTELSRVSRSLRDFLQITDEWRERDVEFVSLRENFDTTSPHGNLIVTILMVLYQFEREQTALRTRLNMRARAERGLFNGGAVAIGYKLDPENSGHLLIDPESAEPVNKAFQLYLKLGAPQPVADRLNDLGHRTPAGKKFSWNIVNYMLQNPAYLC